MHLIYGVAENDVGVAVSWTIDGRRYKAADYSKWMAMIQRCYSDYGKKHNSSYVQHSVSGDWLKFSNYRKWYKDNEIEGFDIDKDILSKESKIYSPETCVFVPKNINRMLVLPKKNKLPYGVHYEKSSGKYKAQGQVGGKYRNLGRYCNAQDAHFAWQKSKSFEIEKAVKEYAQSPHFNTKVADALLQRVWKINLDMSKKQETLEI